MAAAPKSAERPPDLTTTKAPFIEEARAHGEIYIIEQPYELYSAENQATWGRLLERMRDPWARYANRRFLEGMAKLQLSAARIPHLDEVNRFLQPLTGFRARAVSGYVPSYVFFDCLRRREFPTTITIRDGERLEYLPEPDIFHDVAGHVPMHTDRAFAAALVRFGDAAEAAAQRAAALPDQRERLRRLTSNIRAMSRFFWFSVEFGLMRHAGDQPGEAQLGQRDDADGALKVYGSGLLSSFGEIAHAIDAPEVERRPFDIAEVVNQPFEIDHYQPLLYIVDSFDHLFALVNELEAWMQAGKLDDVAGGEPAVSESDLASFLRAH
ncbi:MAG TPA: phenylalanine 4-monooxygenase [Polyangia bacterium]|nr:phenylalanine 4-monooxygenase [Polyangia bacterium]